MGHAAETEELEVHQGIDGAVELHFGGGAVAVQLTHGGGGVGVDERVGTVRFVQLGQDLVDLAEAVE
jgi:hypothetical protein